MKTATAMKQVQNTLYTCPSSLNRSANLKLGYKLVRQQGGNFLDVKNNILPRDIFGEELKYSTLVIILEIASIDMPLEQPPGRLHS